MSASATALLGYVAWTLALILINEVLRSILVLSGRKAANSFHPDGADVSPFAHRLARAHANCIENFPIIGGLLVLALVTGHSSITDPLAPWLLAARIAQTSTHLVSTSSMAVFVRFGFYAAQLGIATWWVILFLQA
jgi:uncharacterized MAPEG superfamily protein